MFSGTTLRFPIIITVIKLHTYSFVPQNHSKTKYSMHLKHLLYQQFLNYDAHSQQLFNLLCFTKSYNNFYGDWCVSHAITLRYRVYAYDVNILVSLNNEKTAMLVSQINPEGDFELFCNAKTSLCFIKQTWRLVTRVHTLYIVCIVFNVLCDWNNNHSMK